MNSPRSVVGSDGAAGSVVGPSVWAGPVVGVEPADVGSAPDPDGDGETDAVQPARTRQSRAAAMRFIARLYPFARQVVRDGKRDPLSLPAIHRPRTTRVPMKVGVVRERAPNERRVALVPELVGKLPGAGLEVLVEAGAGAGALIPDGAYAEAGATVVTTEALYAQADVIVRVQKPDSRRDRQPARRPGRRRAAASRSSTRPTAKTLADAA